MSTVNNLEVMIVGKSTTAAMELQMPNIREFWEWVLNEKARRPKLSYQRMADAGAKQGVILDRSSIVKAIAHNSTPSPEMIRLIAAAFDMSVGEVEVQAGLKSRVPQDVVDNRPLIMTVISNAQQMSDAELEQIVSLQKTMIEQKRRQLKNGKNHSRTK